ncbi:hypothetical protein FQZ97_851770 [compost metagenome]
MCACSSSITAQWTFRPSSVLPSAASGENLLAEFATVMQCCMIATPQYVRRPGVRSAINFASSKTMRAWSRVVAAL